MDRRKVGSDKARGKVRSGMDWNGKEYSKYRLTRVGADAVMTTLFAQNVRIQLYHIGSS